MNKDVANTFGKVQLIVSMLHIPSEGDFISNLLEAFIKKHDCREKYKSVVYLTH